MKYFILIIAVSIITGCGITEPILDPVEAPIYSLGKTLKVIVCHKNSEDNYNMIEISESALQAHLNHGDGQSGDDVPGKDGFIFSEDCDCVEDCPSTIEYAGQIYNTVKIGEQCWFKENLNVGSMIASTLNQTNNGVIEKYCRYDNETYCDTYGGWYQWDEVMQYTTVPGTQGICPNNWHVPTIGEFEVLKNTVGEDGNSLKAIGQGTGTNTSGFSALLASSRDIIGQWYVLSWTNFWSSTQEDAINAKQLFMAANTPYIFLTSYRKEGGFSVRCIKD